MDREQICIALAKRIGQVITAEMAIEMINEAQAVPSQSIQLVDTGEPVTLEQVKFLDSCIHQAVQVDAPTKHYFAPGLYAREQFIPAGAVLTGAVHKTEHLSLFVGDVTILAEGNRIRLTGHHTFVDKPGTKRRVFAHADTWCTGFFPSEKTDLDELEADLAETPHLLQTKLQRTAQLSRSTADLLEN